MVRSPRTFHISDVVTNLAMGALLGSFFALTLLVGNIGHFYELAIGSTSPASFVAVFTGISAAVFGAGATLSGFILVSLERERRDRLD